MSDDLKLASFAQDGWQLDSGTVRHREAPNTFWIPEERVRDSVSVGDFVKLIFEYDIEATEEDSRTGERMWVEVTERVDQFFVGLLDNEPIVARERHMLAVGTRIVFLSEHIIDVL